MKSLYKKSFWENAPNSNSKSDLQTVFQNIYNIPEAEKKSFFHPQFSDFKKFPQFPQQEKTTKRIIHALKNREKILIIGDFDADGITSTVALVYGLKKLGGIVSYLIPDRIKHGHGITAPITKKIIAESPHLVITCDCASNDKNEIKKIREKNIDVIITDHHRPTKNLAVEESYSILNPQVCGTPEYKDLAGVGVVFFLLLNLFDVLLEEFEKQVISEKILELAAIGTIADCMNIVGVNRTIVALGIKALKKTQWKFLQSFFISQKISPLAIDSETIGFSIAPHINSVSRVGNIAEIIKLFLEDKIPTTNELQNFLNFNILRKKKTKKLYEDIFNKCSNKKELQVIYEEGLPVGIIGLVASQLSNNLGVPIVIITNKESDDQKIVCSCRSPKGYSTIEMLDEVSSFFINYGGHSGAGGFVAKKDKKDLIIKKLQTAFLNQGLILQKIVPTTFVTPKLLESDYLKCLLISLEPFGRQNHNPVFGLKNLDFVEIRRLGKTGEHKNLILKINNSLITFICFFAPELEKKVFKKEKIDILFTIKRNYWNNKWKNQFYMQDIRKSEEN